jgi:hypothetical protein
LLLEWIYLLSHVNSRTIIEEVFTCNSGSTKIVKRNIEFWKRRSNFYESHDLADHELELRIRKEKFWQRQVEKDNKESSSINLKLWYIQVNCNNRSNNNELFLSAFPYYEKQLFASSHLSARPHGTTRHPLGGVLWNFLSIFRKFVRKFRDQFKSNQNNERFT